MQYIYYILNSIANNSQNSCCCIIAHKKKANFHLNDLFSKGNCVTLRREICKV